MRRNGSSKIENHKLIIRFWELIGFWKILKTSYFWRSKKFIIHVKSPKNKISRKFKIAIDTYSQQPRIIICKNFENLQNKIKISEKRHSFVIFQGILGKRSLGWISHSLENPLIVSSVIIANSVKSVSFNLLKLSRLILWLSWMGDCLACISTNPPPSPSESNKYEKEQFLKLL